MGDEERAGQAEEVRLQGERGGRRAADPDRLLPGEDPASRDTEDAVHWVTVYRELLSFKEQVLGLTRRYAADGRPEVASELHASDLPLLEAERERLERRLRFWEDRHAALSG